MAEEFPHTVDGLFSGSYYPVPKPKGLILVLNYSTNAARPQGLAIYGPDKLKYEEWYSTANMPNEKEISESDEGDEIYYLAGFAHYPSSPSGQWIQSKMKYNKPEVGFDDYMNDGDFNDLVVTISYKAITDEN